jgi:chemotaxis protein methyltransferase CheR
MTVAVQVHHTELEIRLLLEAIFVRYHYDFRSYAMASLKRRLAQACAHLACPTLSRLQERVLHEPETFAELLQYLTIQVSDMYRDPEFFRAIRTQIVPILKTYPSVKVWVAGCSTGEEAYSLAILLQEEGMLERAILYATDINARSLRTAESGIYKLARMRQFTENHRRSGGRGSLSDYYHAAGDAAVMDSALRKKITFSDHSLATDSVFSEVHLVSCRNVLIYFNRELQSRALGLFDDALCSLGFLGLGSKESLRFSAVADRFAEYCAVERIYRKVPAA